MAANQIKVLFLVFDGVNTLDVNGPLEVLCNYALRKNVGDNPNWCPFHISIASRDTKPVRAYEFINLLSYISFEDALTNIENKTYDVLITPGYAPSSTIDNLIAKKDPIFDVIKAFFATDSSDKQRWIISICVGALLHAYAGVFDGQKATTHWGAVASKGIERFSKNKATSIRTRWYEGEPVRNIRILSSGGISCGIDAMLYYLSQVDSIGVKGAYGVAQMMDYSWNGGPTPPSDINITQQIQQ